MRLRKVNSVINELEERVRCFPNLRKVYFETETIGINMDFDLELCKALKEFNEMIRQKLSFGVNLRIVPKVNYETLYKALKEANFRNICIGIESGSKRIRENILKRYYSNKDIIENIGLAKKYGLNVSTYNMVGIPDETLEDFQKTIICNRICQPDSMQISIFYPYPGTNLEKNCRERGLLTGEFEEKMERCRAVFDLPGFSKKQIQKQFQWFHFNVYRGYKPFYVLLAFVIRSKLRVNSYTNRLYRRVTSSVLSRRIKLIFPIFQR